MIRYQPAHAVHLKDSSPLSVITFGASYGRAGFAAGAGVEAEDFAVKGFSVR